MKTIKSTLFGLAAACAALMTVSAARADGIATHATALPDAPRAALEKEIASYRVAHPEAFEQVRSVRGYRPEVYGHARNPRPRVGNELRALGPSALLPMLDELAFEAPARDGATDAEWGALAVGLLEATGSLRDARSAPVLRAIFEGGGSAGITAAAGRALGRLGGDAELALLVKHASPSDPLHAAAIEGLGNCMRLESAKQLATMLSSAKDDATATALAKALGSVGSAWAWESLGPSAAATSTAVRDVAAKALVQAYALKGPDARPAITTAILVLHHAGVPALITSARASAEPGIQGELDNLSRVVAQSLSH